MPTNCTDMTGQVIGRLTVIERLPRVTRRGGVRWRCRCACGKEIRASGPALRSHHTRSCGCLKRDQIGERRRTHGMCTTPADKNGFAMKARCNDPRDDAYRWYGGRGITVCAAWAESFEAFLRDIGPRPSRRHTLDRIDNARGYEPGNVRWATRLQQMRNTRANRWLECNGGRLTIQDWARRIGASHATIHTRLQRGWPLDKALTTPPKIGRNQHR